MWGGAAFRNGEPLGDGAAYNPATTTWRRLSPSPLDPQAELGSVWTGEELILWTSAGDAAAWTPIENHWRRLENWPLRARKSATPVWTGHEIVDLPRGVAVDPNTGQARRITIPAGTGDRSGMVWTGTEILVLAEGHAYDPATDTWHPLPHTIMSRGSVAGAWNGEVALAVDYLMNSAAYHPRNASWISLPSVPLQFFGCTPRLLSAGSSVIAEMCGGIGVFQKGAATWLPLSLPSPYETNTVTVIGDEVYAWGDGFYRLDSEVLRGTRSPTRLALGISLLDLPSAWAATTARLKSPGTIGIDLVGPFFTSCRAVAMHRPAHTEDGGNGSPEDSSRFTWMISATEAIDVACNDGAATQSIVRSIWAP